MAGLSVRCRAFALLFAFVVGLGLSTAPAVGHRDEVGPRAGAPVLDALDRDRLVVGVVSRSSEPVKLVWPADGLRTGWWGEPRGGRSHPGLDIDGETGDPVSSAGRGTVVLAGPAPAGYSGFGTLVEIDHGQGVRTLYTHLSATEVETGDVVQAGEQVGAIGSTGNVTGSHLHFEVRVGGQQVDPETWLPPRQQGAVPVEPSPQRRSRFF